MDNDEGLTINLFGYNIRIYEFYNMLSNFNDIILAIFFILGSIDFFSSATTKSGTIFFLIGSIQLLIKPMIAIAKDVHINIMRDKNKG